MITLYGFTPAFGLPDPSPFVVKVATYLRMIEVPFELRGGNMRNAPKGKLPYLEDGGTVVADSTFIVDYLRKKYRDLDVGISAHERALAVACKSMLEEHFYFVMVMQRWKEDAGFAILKEGFYRTLKQSGVPGFAVPLLGNFIRKQVTKTLIAQGVGRHSFAEAEELGIGHLEALTELISDKRYFLGDTPRSIDATVFAFLWLIVGTPYEGRIKAYVQSQPRLVAYTERMRVQYWKESL